MEDPPRPRGRTWRVTCVLEPLPAVRAQPRVCTGLHCGAGFVPRPLFLERERNLTFILTFYCRLHFPGLGEEPSYSRRRVFPTIPFCDNVTDAVSTW